MYNLKDFVIRNVYYYIATCTQQCCFLMIPSAKSWPTCIFAPYMIWTTWLGSNSRFPLSTHTGRRGTSLDPLLPASILTDSIHGLKLQPEQLWLMMSNLMMLFDWKVTYNILESPILTRHAVCKPLQSASLARFSLLPKDTAVASDCETAKTNQYVNVFLKFLNRQVFPTVHGRGENIQNKNSSINEQWKSDVSSFKYVPAFFSFFCFASFFSFLRFFFGGSSSFLGASMQKHRRFSDSMVPAARFTSWWENPTFTWQVVVFWRFLMDEWKKPKSKHNVLH